MSSQHLWDIRVGCVKSHTLTTNFENMGKFLMSSCLFPYLSNGNKDTLPTGAQRGLHEMINKVPSSVLPPRQLGKA